MSRGRLLPRIWRQTRLTSCITAPKTASAPAFRQHSACKVHNADESRPTKIPYHASGTSPVRPDQYGLPSFLSLCCRLAPITRASAAPVGASRVPQTRSAHLSAAVARSSPQVSFRIFKQRPSGGAHSPQQLASARPYCFSPCCCCWPAYLWSPPSPSTQAGYLPGYAFSHVDKYLAASPFCPYCPQPETSWEYTACRYS